MEDKHTSPAPNTVDEDQYYRLLSDENRRLVLATLAETGPTTLLALAEAVSNGKSVPQSVDETAVKLHHVHLPMLDDAGVIAYDAAGKHVDPIEPVPHFED
jgi:predicted transcriptional regulator